MNKIIYPTIMVISVLALAVKAEVGLTEDYVSPNIATAIIERTLTYQGILKDISGNPVPDASYNVTFRLYDLAVGGSALWNSGVLSIATSDGYFTKEFGPISLPFDKAYYLSIQVASDPEMAQRQKITMTPYSGVSDTANYAFAGAWGSSYWTPVDSVIYTDGYWGIARGGAGNMLYGDSAYTHINLGTACTTGTAGNNEYCSTVGGGKFNIAGGSLSTVSGGGSNNAGGESSVVGGGNNNIASGMRSIIGGGYYNTASGAVSAIGGGTGNVANNGYTAVAGGGGNTSSGWCSFVGGGWLNTSNSRSSTIGGGDRNAVFADYGTVAGGVSDTVNSYMGGIASGYSNLAGDQATDTCAFIGGGNNNTATGKYTVVSGGRDNIASGYAATVGGGNLNTANDFYSTIAGGDSNISEGIYSFVGGGHSNDANGYYATISGGRYNSTFGGSPAIGGGHSNRAGNYGAISGGYSNMADNYSSISGGQSNTATGYSATICGGDGNSVGGSYSAILGGSGNANNGYYCTILGGEFDTLQSSLSMAFGYNVFISGANQVEFFDGAYYGRFGVNRDDRDGGLSHPIHVGTSTSNGNGAYLTAGGTWTNTSSRTVKENFTPFENNTLLDKINGLSVTTWNFKSSTEKHIGPVAEEFVAAFDVGVIREEDGLRDNRALAAGDVAGVALAGVQELITQNKELKAENENMKTMIENLERRLSEIENRH